jgi:predicted component of viral defense system (DUF524 family)
MQFENQLGLARIQPFASGRPIGPGKLVEVVARKFATVAESTSFLDRLLMDLFAEGAMLPFLVNAPTGRLVQEVRRPPNLLFAFHFFRRHGRELVRALQTIGHRPLLRLFDVEEFVGVDQVRGIDLDAMMSVLTYATANDRRAPSIAHRLRPERVRQRLPVETIDTPENRFVLTAARRFLDTAKSVQRASWYDASVSLHDRSQLSGMVGDVSRFVQDRQFLEVGHLGQMPAASRVLQRRDDYREVTHLWFAFQRARQPLFDRLDHAIDIRDVATLYEYWVFFELARQIGEIHGVKGRAETPATVGFGLSHASFMHYPGTGRLYFNLSRKGYSGVSLRPDYLWVPETGRPVAFDAKFRMHHSTLAAMAGEIPEDATYFAKDDDLVKMHAYRDALGVRAAVVIYPGTISTFRGTDGAKGKVTIEQILSEPDLTGVGEIAMSPILTAQVVTGA